MTSCCALRISAWALVIAFLLLCIDNAYATIVLTGEYTPTYNGTDDPWDVGDDLAIGGSGIYDDGDGTLVIDGGSTVNNSTGTLGGGIDAMGSVTVRDTASMWANSSRLYIGQYGEGDLTVEAGGAVTSSSAEIGYYYSSYGVVTVTGEGSIWNANGSLDIGDAGDGTLNIEAGGEVAAGSSWISSDSGATGTVNVLGEGSEWNLARELYVAYYGNGSLNISSGVVNVGEETVVGVHPPSHGTIYFDDGTLNTGDLRAALADLRGTGTVNTRGICSDVDLIFSEATGLQQQLNLSELADQNITLNLDMSNPTENGSLGVGYRNVGSLRIEDGVSVNSSFGSIGHQSGSNGTATVIGYGSEWNNSFSLVIGGDGTGTLSIEDGGYVGNGAGTIGSDAGANGTVIVTGAGSTWHNSSSLAVGDSGIGRLDILDGGVVNVDAHTWIGSDSYGTGEINFDGGTLNTDGLLAAPGDLHGTGTINCQGLVSDLNVTFDATTGLHPQLAVNGLPGQNITINLDMPGLFSLGKSYLGAGYRGAGTLTITDGLFAHSLSGQLGYHPGSTGTAIVTGPGSKWYNDDYLYVGRSGDGILAIEDGATISNRIGVVGPYIGSTGTVTVSGIGSEWNNRNSLYLGRPWLVSVGSTGDGILNIVNGGLVRVDDYLVIDDGSYINMDTGGMLALEGDAAGSLDDYFELVHGVDAINFWDGSEWADIHNAILGVDYTLDYHDSGTLIGFTVLTVGTLPLAGDFDADGDVDGADFLKWQQDDGTASSLANWNDTFGLIDSELPLAADFDQDGNVDADDLAVWSTYFGLVDPLGRPVQKLAMPI